MATSKDIISDVIKHTTALGDIIKYIKISGNEKETLIDSMDTNQVVVINARTHAPVKDFEGEFGMGNLSFISAIIRLPNYTEEGSSATVIRSEKNGSVQPDKIVFNDDGGNRDEYRFMSKQLIDTVLQSYVLNINDWDVVFEPTKAKIMELQKFSAVYGGVEAHFTASTEDGDLVISMGDPNGTISGRRIFAKDIGTLEHSYAWPMAQVLSVMKLGIMGSNNCVVSISSKGVFQISIESDFGTYNYMFPALNL